MGCFLYWFFSYKPVNKLNLPGKALDNCQKTIICCSSSLTGHLYKVLILIMVELLEDFVVIFINHSWRKHKESHLKKISLKLVEIPFLLLNKIIKSTFRNNANNCNMNINHGICYFQKLRIARVLSTFFLLQLCRGITIEVTKESSFLWGAVGI